MKKSLEQTKIIDTTPAFCSKCGAELAFNKEHAFEAFFCDKCEREIQNSVASSKNKD